MANINLNCCNSLNYASELLKLLITKKNPGELTLLRALEDAELGRGPSQAEGTVCKVNPSRGGASPQEDSEASNRNKCKEKKQNQEVSVKEFSAAV